MTIDRSDDHKPEASRRSRRTKRPPTASEPLEELPGYPWPLPGRPPKQDLTTWTVTDDWPDSVPVTEAEIEVFERWLGDLFDELFCPDSQAVSHCDVSYSVVHTPIVGMNL